MRSTLPTSLISAWLSSEPLRGFYKSLQLSQYMATIPQTNPVTGQKGTVQPQQESETCWTLLSFLLHA